MLQVRKRRADSECVHICKGWTQKSLVARGRIGWRGDEVVAITIHYYPVCIYIYIYVYICRERDIYIYI